MRPEVSVIIPVLNEAGNINQVVDHILGLPGGDREIVIVDGSPGCETLQAVERAGVKKISSGPGRGLQMNRGAEAASGEVLVFLHADTFLPEAAFLLIAKAAADPEIVGGAFDLGINSGRKVFRLIERAASLRSRITRIPYGDQGIFLRRKCFMDIGGFKEIPIMEDVELMSRVRRLGGRLSIIREKVLTSPRRWEREGIAACTARNWTLITLYLVGVAPERLARFYRTDRPY